MRAIIKRAFSSATSNSSTNTPKSTSAIASISEMNDKLKEKHHNKKSEKTYISRMSPERVQKIGSATLLDK